MVDKNNKPIIDTNFTADDEKRLKQEFDRKQANAQADKNAALEDKIMAAWHGQARFKICDTRIVEQFKMDGIGLRAGITQSEKHTKKSKTTSYALSVEVCYHDLYELHKAAPFKSEKERSLSEEFNQKRASSLQIGQYDSLESLKHAFTELNREFLLVLSEAGAENSRLEVTNGAYSIINENSDTQAGNFSDALKLARQIQYLRLLDTDEYLNYGQARLALIQPILQDNNLELDVMREYVFGNETTHYKASNDEHHDLGRFQIMNVSADMAAVLTSYKSIHAQDSQVFNGSVTGRLLQRHFFNRIFDAAAELGLIGAEKREHLVPQITQYRNVPLIGNSYFAPAA
tara:strand:- start:158022 stop:159056 length:1035 start_codon:yes stop_codon:yes gene_type:complete